jgi:hypothetical protein
VDDALVVRDGHGVADLAVNGEQPVERGMLGGQLVALLDGGEDGLERAALHQLHRVEAPALLVAAHVVDGHDVRVREPREPQRLAQEALPRDLVLLGGFEQDFHRHLAVERLVIGFEDCAHAAARDLAAHEITPAVSGGEPPSDEADEAMWCALP